MKKILKAKNLSKFYQMGEITVKALQEVNLDIYEGEFIVILGPSGSGKSTLLNLVGGMDSITSGELYYRGQPLHAANEKMLTAYRRDAVGFVFQFFNLMPNLTAFENVNLSVEIARDPLDPLVVLKDVGLEKRKDHFPSQLSGGEQQRVALARALAKNPDILLCDEPTGSLDTKTSIEVLKILKNFCFKYGKTVIIITHNENMAVMADRVIYIKDGHLEKIKVNEQPVEPEMIQL